MGFNYIRYSIEFFAKRMGKGELNVATTGNLLRSERERQGWTLQEVSVAIHIKIEYLQALEMDQYDCIPGEVFVKGFIRCYASFLGISGESLVSIYKKKGITVDKDNKGPSSMIDVKETRIRKRYTKKKARWVEISLVAGFLIFLVLIIWMK